MRSIESGTRIHPSRIRWLRAGSPAQDARFVLYWVQINQRARMNDALDFAIEQADALDLPVLVYQGLRPDYPAANDRIHAFILEGACDLARELREKGIQHLFHLERRRGSASGLVAALAREAAMVVTDHFPTFIVPGQTRALARQIGRPIAAVDASCIVPLDLFPAAELAARTLRPKVHRILHEHLVAREEIAPRRASLGIEVPFPFVGRGIDADEHVWLDLAEIDEPMDGRTRTEIEKGTDGESEKEAGFSGAEAPWGGRSGLFTSRPTSTYRGSPHTRVLEWVSSCAIDHGVLPSTRFRGGSREARRRLGVFVRERLAGYPTQQNDPAVCGTSGLSPYLHFGQIAALEVALAVLGSSVNGTSSRMAETDRKSVGGKNPLSARADAARPREGGAQGMTLASIPGSALGEATVVGAALGHDSAAMLAPLAPGEALSRALADRESPAGAFLEQLIVRRELAFNFCERNPQHASIEGIPAWAMRTLDAHAMDARRATYKADLLEWGETEDEVWNAAQTELRSTGVIHNRLRMLWGKKILEWSETPAAAVETMIRLHDKYALDGRDPNTYANILWCLGLHDRPFGPARPILGTVRPMSSDVLSRKFDMDAYRRRVDGFAKGGEEGSSPVR